MKDFNPNLNPQRGLIRIILLVIIAVLVLGYFNISIKKDVVDKPATQDNINYVVSGASKIWREYLSKPVQYFWNNIFLDLLWKAFLENFDQIKKGQPPTNFKPNETNTLPAYNP